MIKVAFSVDVNGAVSALTGIGGTTENAVLQMGETLAQEAELSAKLLAPWQDRTGNARRTLDGWSYRDESDADTFYIGLSGHMEYSPVLELGHDGRYAIIVPVISELADRLKNMRLF